MMGNGLAIGLSIGALVVSILSPIFEYYWNKKMNNLNLSSEYFREIYGKIIYEDLPIAREHIHFSDNKLTGTDKMLGVLRVIRMRSIYYKRLHTDFYDDLIGNVQAFEDYLVISPETMSSECFAKFFNQVDIHIANIYECLSTAYLGGK